MAGSFIYALARTRLIAICSILRLPTGWRSFWEGVLMYTKS